MAAASGSSVTGMVCEDLLELRLSFRDGPQDQTRNLEIPGSVLSDRPGMTTLSGGATAIHGVGGARDVARLVGGEERHDGRDLGRLSKPPRRNPVDDLFIRRRLVAG